MAQCRVLRCAYRSLSFCVLQCVDEGVGMYIRHKLHHTGHNGRSKTKRSNMNQGKQATPRERTIHCV